MRIIGIDPGFGRTGYGIIEKQHREWVHVADGCIETNPKADFVDRLYALHLALKKIITQYNPTHAAVEELFFAKNVTTAINVGQARGVILLTLRQAKLPVAEFTPLQVKQTVVGYGRAEKHQVQEMLKLQLKLPKRPVQDDAADALAVALTAGVSKMDE